VRASTDIEDYCADTVGACLQIPNGLVFCASPVLWGWALWGRPSRADVARIPQLLELELGPEVARHASIVDLRYLEDANPSAFVVLARFLQENAAAIGDRLTQVALVRPGGYLGMIVAGFHDVVGAPYPLRVFECVHAAAAWVEACPVAAGDIDAAVQAGRLASAALVKLRAWLDDNITDATLDSAARALARAPRSLQRDLRAVQSSFQRELEEARIRCAKRLLARTQKSLTEIAYDVGCASPQHFSVLFRRRIGLPPSAWRALHRAR
jgi:AraC-like DNA-binding protein